MDVLNNLTWDIVSDKIRTKYIQSDSSDHKAKNSVYFLCIQNNLSIIQLE